jgi:dinuclear metal center YbgI/SA1388 family protein
MTTSELYRILNERIPASLSCDWDNDGIMCLPEPDREVKKVLLPLDITEAVVDQAVAENFDVIISHHPLLFHGVKHMTVDDPVARRAIKLCRAGIAAFSFHTRLDALQGGVNDVLAKRLSLTDAVPFGDDGIGRIGTLAEPMSAEALAIMVADRLNATAVTLSDAGKPVRRVAVLGGGGGDFMADALAAGADAYVTGDSAHHHLVDAPEKGISLIVAGHYHTEYLVLEQLAIMLDELLPDAHILPICSNTVKTIINPRHIKSKGENS